MSNAMRCIFFSSSSSSSGGTRQAMYLARALKDKGMECLFFVPKGSTIADKDPHVSWRFLFGPAGTWKDQIAREILPERSIIHFFHGQAFKLAALWGLGRMGREAALVVNRGVTFFPKNPLPYWSFGLDAFVVNSKACARQLRMICVPRRKIHVVYNAVPQSRLELTTDAKGLRERLGIEPRHLVIGSVAGNNAVKGTDILLHAFAQARRPGMRLVVLGATNEKWRSLIEQLGLRDSAHLMGFTENVADYMSIFDVFVLPSRRESMPNTLVEAMLCGRPLVAAKVGGVAEVAEDCALLFEPGRVEDLARHLRSMADNLDLRRKYARLAVENGRQFGMERKTDEILAIYKQILRKKFRMTL